MKRASPLLVTKDFVLSDGCTLRPVDRLLLLAISDFARVEKRLMIAWPSVPTLARRTGLSDASIRRGLKRLEAAEMIARERRFNPNGAQGADLITLRGSQPDRGRGSQADRGEPFETAAPPVTLIGPPGHADYTPLSNGAPIKEEHHDRNITTEHRGTTYVVPADARNGAAARHPDHLEAALAAGLRKDGWAERRIEEFLHDRRAAH